MFRFFGVFNIVIGVELVKLKKSFLIKWYVIFIVRFGKVFFFFEIVCGWIMVESLVNYNEVYKNVKIDEEWY